MSNTAILYLILFQIYVIGRTGFLSIDFDKKDDLPKEIIKNLIEDIKNCILSVTRLIL